MSCDNTCEDMLLEQDYEIEQLSEEADFWRREAERYREEIERLLGTDENTHGEERVGGRRT